MRILVVDDDRSVRDALRRALTLAGYDVQMAEGGQQALTQAATAVPDAVVLDVGMPDVDGIEVCQRLRRGGQSRAGPDADGARCDRRSHRRARRGGR